MKLLFFIIPCGSDIHANSSLLAKGFGALTSAPTYLPFYLYLLGRLGGLSYGGVKINQKFEYEFQDDTFGNTISQNHWFSSDFTPVAEAG